MNVLVCETAADVAELADALASGASGLRLMEVRILSSALPSLEVGKKSFLEAYLWERLLFDGCVKDYSIAIFLGFFCKGRQMYISKILWTGQQVDITG